MINCKNINLIFYLQRKLNKIAYKYNIVSTNNYQNLNKAALPCPPPLFLSHTRMTLDVVFDKFLQKSTQLQKQGSRGFPAVQ